MKKFSFIQKASTLIAKNKVKRSFDKSIMHPEREWALIIFSFLIIISLGTIWSIINFNKFKEVSLSNTNVSEVSLYNGTIVQSALDVMSAREEKYNDLIKLIKKSPINKEGELPTDGSPVTSSNASSVIETTETEQAITAEDILNNKNETTEESIKGKPELAI